MKLKNSHFLILKIFLILFLFLSPWAIADYTDNISAGIPSQEDMSFYEVNPCKVSLIEFLIKVPSSIFQDHYFFRFNDYSSIECFGKISGVTLVNNGFHISVGTNSFVNLVLQTLFWLTLISMIKRDDYKFKINKFLSTQSILITVLVLFTTFISENRFYEKNLYIFDIVDFKNKLYIAIFFSVILLLSLNIIYLRINKIVNFFPLFFIFNTVYSGFNFSLLLCIFIYFGVYFFLNNKKSFFKKLYLIYLFLPIFWFTNSSGRYSFKTDKLRGFTSSNFESLSNFSWSLIFIFSILGVCYLLIEFKSSYKFGRIFEIFNISTFLMLILSLLSSQLPIVNFLNYYYLGSQKYGVKITNPFIFDEYGSKIAWRGLFSSSESIGEIYSLFLIFTIFIYFSKYNFKPIYIVGIISSIFGLYFSNNRAAILLFIFIFIYLFIYKNKTNRRYLAPALIVFLIFSIWQIGFSNFGYSIDFLGTYTFNKASEFEVIGKSSTFYNLTEYIYTEGSSLKYLMYPFSVIAFFLNRSILWGLFISRYNPSIIELFLGSGPLSFGKFFSEVNVTNVDSLLLPHSSFLSYLVFIGLGGLGSLIFLFIKALRNKNSRLNQYEFSIILFIFLNLIKSDSLLYLQMIFVYSFLIYQVLRKDDNKFFKF